MILGRVDTGGSCVLGCVHTSGGKCRECGHIALLECVRCHVPIEAWQYDSSALCLECEEVRRLEDRALVAAFRGGNLAEVCAELGYLEHPGLRP